MATTRIEDWGLVPYDAAHALQHERVAHRIAGSLEHDVLARVEHPTIVTLGRGSDPKNILDATLPRREIERGGDVTLHGPGQLVGYWIRLLPAGRRDLRAHLRAVED